MKDIDKFLERKDILECLASDWSLKDIAEEVGSSESVVRSFCERLRRHFNVKKYARHEYICHLVKTRLGRQLEAMMYMENEK